MNDKQLETFIKISDCGSFSQAEELLYTSKQALVKRINALEEELGFTLFFRDVKGIKLTKAGKEFYIGAQRLLHIKKQVIEQCLEIVSSTQKLRLNRIESHMLMDKVTYRFTEKYPEIQLQTIVHHDKNERKRVAEKIADIGESPKVKEIEDLNLNYTKLIELPYLCLMSPDHPLSQKSSLTLKQLSDYSVTIDTRQFDATQIQLLNQQLHHLSTTTSTADQIQEAFHICSKGSIFLTPAYYSRFMHPLAAIPLNLPWKREYGLVTRNEQNDAVEKYLELAKTIYQTQAK